MAMRGSFFRCRFGIVCQGRRELPGETEHREQGH